MSHSPFRIALLGDFGPGAARPALARRRIRRVDRDDIDRVLAAFAPELAVALPGQESPLRLAPRALDDFHPDRLVESLQFFRELGEARRRVASQESFERAVALIREEADTRRSAAHGDDAGAETLGLLERIVDAAAYTPQSGALQARDGELERLIRRLVEPHLVREPDARQRSIVEEIDAEMLAALGAVVQHDAVRDLESAWRTVDFLVRRLDTDESLQLHLVDVSRDELVADLASSDDDPARGVLARQLAGVAEQGWAAVVGLFSLDGGPEDAHLARQLARLGRALGAPMLLGAQPQLVGAATFAGEIDGEWEPTTDPAWEVMRDATEASWLGLVAPRFLLRLPYGAAGEPCERLPFEEVVEEPSPTAHDRYCWGNGAAIAALLLGDAFALNGWSLRPEHEVRGLPLHLRRDGGDPVLLSCAEGTMFERGAIRLLESGIMPLAWMRDSDAVRLVRFQSVAREGAPISGRWTQEVRG